MPKAQPKVFVAPQMIHIEVPIIGTSELIMHAWSEKARKQMLDKQMGKAKEKRPPKDPMADYEATIYHNADGKIVFPAGAFKAAIVSACRLVDGLPMTKVKQAIRVEGDWVEIKGKPRMREDMVRNETGVADIRYRAGFPLWSATLPITFVESVVTAEQVISLVELSGLGGIGDWRPTSPNSASGSFGCYKVLTENRKGKA
jgi:hypothetical protein